MPIGGGRVFWCPASGADAAENGVGRRLFFSCDTIGLDGGCDGPTLKAFGAAGGRGAAVGGGLGTEPLVVSGSDR